MSTTNRLIVRGACPHDCPDTCGVITEVEDGRAVDFHADPDHPITHGWLCAKVRPYLDHVYHPDRLLHPLRRVGPKGSGEWQRISWDEAICRDRDSLAGDHRQHGARRDPALLLQRHPRPGRKSSSPAPASGTAWAPADSSARICDAAATAPSRRRSVARWAAIHDDVMHSKLVIIWGHNPASTRPHFIPLLREAQRNGTYVVVIDPRRTLTARCGRSAPPTRPATDGALALGLMHVLFSEGRHDEAWLDAPRARLARAARARSPTIRRARRGDHRHRRRDHRRARPALRPTPRPASLKFADGIKRHRQRRPEPSARSLALPAVIGQYGTRAAGCPTARAVTCPGTMRRSDTPRECPPHAAHRQHEPPRGRADSARLPIRPIHRSSSSTPTRSPRLRTRPKIIEGLMRDDLFTVVHEQFMTDTAHFADIVLPATSQLEVDDLVKPYGHRHVHFNKAAMAPLRRSARQLGCEAANRQGDGFYRPLVRPNQS